MAVLLMVSIMMVIAVPLIQRQLADRQLDMVARNFVRHANFARNQALYLGEFVQLVPHNEHYWGAGVAGVYAIHAWTEKIANSSCRSWD